MPYYVYKISAVSNNIVKQLEKVAEYDGFKEAKHFAREQRANQPAASDDNYKVIFAQSQLEAEEMLMEKRQAPILKEWEK